MPVALGVGYAVGDGLGNHLERVCHVAGRIGIILLGGAAIVVAFLLIEGALRILMMGRIRYGEM